MIDKRKLDELRICCAMLDHFPDNAEYLKKATALARELFPPMAKPLSWSNGYKVIIGYFGGVRTHSIHPAMNKFFARDHEGLLIKECATEAEAVAACESHHQARFLEQMA